MCEWNFFLNRWIFGRVTSKNMIVLRTCALGQHDSKIRKKCTKQSPTYASVAYLFTLTKKTISGKICQKNLAAIELKEIKMTYVSFWAHIKIASRMVSYRIMLSSSVCLSVRVRPSQISVLSKRRIELVSDTEAPFDLSLTVWKENTDISKLRVRSSATLS